ncbi:MAG: hypothetical protein ACK53T_07830 [Planctomycetota bacterium]|jgi:hypothetical protein
MIGLKDKVTLFVTAFVQVTFVAMSSVSIINNSLIMIGVTGFMISFIWTLNVKKVAFGNTRDRFIYAIGAMLGTYCGYFLSKYLITII